MFADDLAIISVSASGLQRCLTILYEYCDKWCLSINISKTKVIIFNKTGRTYNMVYSFNINGCNVEIVNEYCYLGIIFQPSGIFSKAAKHLYAKAIKAKFHMMRILQGFNVSVKVGLQLFKSLILPILSYGCEIIHPIEMKNFAENKYYTLSNKSFFESVT